MSQFEIYFAEGREHILNYKFGYDHILFIVALCALYHPRDWKKLLILVTAFTVGEKCPGRIGQWVGWEIVNKYRETHPNVSLTQLMQMPNAEQIFKESRYRPEKR